MASDYAVDGSRIGEDGASSVSWSAVCDTDVTNWSKSTKAVVAISASSGSHTPATESFKIQWRNLTDGGSFADITNSGELRNGTSAGALSNGTSVTTPAGCGTGSLQDSEECENETPHLTGGLAQSSKDNHIEVQSCIDFTYALAGKEYEFRLWSDTDGSSAGTASATITVTAPVTYNIDRTIDIRVKKSFYVDNTIDIAVKRLGLYVDKTIDIRIKKSFYVDNTINIRVKKVQNIDKTIDITVQTAVTTYQIDKTVDITIKSTENVDKTLDVTVKNPNDDPTSWFISSDAEQNVTSASYTEFATLEFTAPALGDYLIIVSAQMSSDIGLGEPACRAQLDDTTTIMESMKRAYADGLTDYVNHASFYVAENLAAGDHYVDVDAHDDSNNNVKIKEIKITVIRLDDWIDGYYEYSNTEAETGIANSWTTVESITFTPEMAGGDYLILATIHSDPNGSQYDNQLRINYDSGSEYLPVINDEEQNDPHLCHEVNSNSEYVTFMWGGIVNIPASSKTIALQQNGDGTIGFIKYRRLIAIRMSAINDVESNEVTTNTSTTSTWADKSTLTFTPPTEKKYFIIGGIAVKPDSIGDKGQARMNHTAGTNTGEVAKSYIKIRDDSATNCIYPLLSFTAKRLAAASQTFKMQWGDQDATNDIFAKNGWLVAFPVDFQPDIIDKTIDIRVKATSYVDKTVNITVQSPGAETHQIDKTLDVTVKRLGLYVDKTIDIRVKKSFYVDNTVDIRVKAENYVDNTLDARIKTIQYIDTTLDARIKNSYYLDKTVNVTVVNTYQIDKTIDVRVKTEYYVDKTVNIAVKSTQSIDKTVNVTVVNTYYVDNTIDIRIKKSQYIDRTIDARIKTSYYVDKTVDITIQSGVTYQIDKTVNIRVKVIDNYIDKTIDARIKTENYIDKTLDVTVVNTYQIDKTIDVRVKVLGNYVDKTIDARIKQSYYIDKTINAKVILLGYIDKTVNITVKNTMNIDKTVNIRVVIPGLETYYIDKTINIRVKQEEYIDKTINVTVVAPGTIELEGDMYPIIYLEADNMGNDIDLKGDMYPVIYLESKK
jgi:hypothetical protein